VCTGVLPGEGRRYQRTIKSNVKSGRSKQRPYQFKTRVKGKSCPPEKQAAATLRSRCAGSKGESRCGAIHKFKRNVKVEIGTSAAKAALRFEFLCHG
jgi:hypothetical protein